MFGKLIHIPLQFHLIAHLYFGLQAKEQSVHYNVPTAIQRQRQSRIKVRQNSIKTIWRKKGVCCRSEKRWGLRLPRISQVSFQCRCRTCAGRRLRKWNVNDFCLGMRRARFHTLFMALHWQVCLFHDPWSASPAGFILPGVPHISEIMPAL